MPPKPGTWPGINNICLICGTTKTIVLLFCLVLAHSFPALTFLHNIFHPEEASLSPFTLGITTPGLMWSTLLREALRDSCDSQ